MEAAKAKLFWISLLNLLSINIRIWVHSCIYAFMRVCILNKFQEWNKGKGQCACFREMKKCAWLLWYCFWLWFGSGRFIEMKSHLTPVGTFWLVREDWFGLIPKESNLSFVPLEKTSMRCKMVVMETKENGGLYYNLFNPVQPFFPQGSHGKCKSTGPWADFICLCSIFKMTGQNVQWP